MIEVEVKVKIEDRNTIEHRLEELAFKKGKLLCETDVYFDRENGEFRKGDKALRIRQYENLTLNEKVSCITYKGPKLDQVSMTRKELEMKIEDGEMGIEILKNLGFIPVQPVVKLRQYFHKANVTACLDQVEGLGAYLELEIIVESEEKREEALEHIMDLLTCLGYGKEDIIRTSYLSMLQKKLYS